MPYWRGLLDARPLGLVTLATHRCRACGSPVEVERVEATTLGEAAARLHACLWGRSRRCACGSTAYPEPVMDEDFLTLGRLGWSWW